MNKYAAVNQKTFQQNSFLFLIIFKKKRKKDRDKLFTDFSTFIMNFFLLPFITRALCTFLRVFTRFHDYTITSFLIDEKYPQEDISS